MKPSGGSSKPHATTSAVDHQAAASSSSAHEEQPSAVGLDKAELERLVAAHMQSGEYESAAFWMEKVLAGSAHLPLRKRLPELAHYLRVLTAGGSWQAIITFVSRHDLFLLHLLFAYYHVNALFRREMYAEIINLPLGHLSRWNDVPFINADATTAIYAELSATRDEEVGRRLDAIAAESNCEPQLLLLLARTYLVVQNRPAATGCLSRCLALNPYSSDAVHLAMQSRLLSASDVQAIVQAASVNNPQSNRTGTLIIKRLLDIHNLNEEPPAVPAHLAELFSSDLSFQSASAFRLYYRGHVEEAYQITSDIIHNFGFYEKCFLVHIASLVELDRVSELYALGHSLVKMQPESEVTWYAVGCYYYATGQYTTGKKFLNKCTTINPGFGEGWVAYGHCLFYAEEHEQAMNSYLRASRILDGHFEPLLYIAVEYCYANNFKLACDFLRDAETVSATNAIVLHEQGTVAFMRKDYQQAESVYRKALAAITRSNAEEAGPAGNDESSSPSLESMLACEVPNFWEPLFNNLGHTLCRLGKHQEAIEVHRKSLILAKCKAEAWGCIGICYASMGDCENAAEALNRALALKPGDDVLRCALDKVLIQAASHATLPSTIFSPGDDENFDIALRKKMTDAAEAGKSGEECVSAVGGDMMVLGADC